MDRRAFFRSLAVGSLAVPGSLKAVSAPAASKVVTLTQVGVRDLTIRGNVILAPTVRVMERCRVIAPWNSIGPLLTVRDHPGPLRVAYNFFQREAPPLWARLLRLRP